MKRTIMSVSALLLLALVCCNKNTVSPQEAAKQFVEDAKIDIRGKPNCTGVDTDGDGYVTCTVWFANPKDGKDSMSIQCADITSNSGGCDGHTQTYATGCKETQQKIQVTKT